MEFVLVGEQEARSMWLTAHRLCACAIDAWCDVVRSVKGQSTATVHSEPHPLIHIRFRILLHPITIINQPALHDVCVWCFGYIGRHAAIGWVYAQTPSLNVSSIAALCTTKRGVDITAETFALPFNSSSCSWSVEIDFCSRRLANDFLTRRVHAMLIYGPFPFGSPREFS
jgi:hypothetical protein